jgi:squalene/oxidosqualene cyclase-like protein
MMSYLRNSQRADGSVGLHVEGDGSLFTTTLCYVAWRLLGGAADAPELACMRRWIRQQGGALYAAPWAKWVLAVLNLYDYDGVAPVTPELWLLPYRAPIHPGRLWCHCRQVYLPMSYLYGKKARVAPDATIHALRDELYDEPYHRIDWPRHRESMRTEEVYSPLTRTMRAANWALQAYERMQAALPVNPLRRRALDEVMHHVRYEDMVTNHIDIGPVNSVLNVMCHHFEEPGGESYRQGLAVLDEYLWSGHDGMKFQGYNNSQLWDTAFAIQAMLATPFADEARETLKRAHGFVRDNQILDDVPQRRQHYRDPSRGGWPFSNRAHGWPITDCTAEGFRVAVALAPRVDEPVDENLLRDAVRLILGWQNEDGGWASYEKGRGGAWLELLNPSYVFSNIMVDYSYPECTSACLQALAVARSRFPGEFDEAIDSAMARSEQFLRETQLPDGSWEGSWGICFTYGTWFGVHGLLAGGVDPQDAAIRNACDFLLSYQRPDGGWGEHHRSCSERRYVQHPEGQVVMTSWALLALLEAGCSDTEAIARGIAFLTRRQRTDGSWPREAIAGVFNRTCAITYDNYRHYFPLWALGTWLSQRCATDTV